MKRGDIVLIKFPFTDLSSNKVRPALVVSSDIYNQRGMDAIFMLITSNTTNPQMTDLLVDSNSAEFAMMRLKKSSLIRTDKIVVLSKNLVSRKLGEAGSEIMSKVDKMLANVLGLEVSNVSQIQLENTKAPEGAAVSSLDINPTKQ